MIRSKLLDKQIGVNHFFSEKNDENWIIGKKGDFIRAQQVHGNKIVYLADNKIRMISRCDGLITDNTDLKISVSTADCMPVLFYEKTRNLIAAVHVGWRGLLKGILPAAVNNIKKMEGKPDQITAVIGPHIRSCCYEVGKDVIYLFRNKYKIPQPGVKRHGSWYLDLEKIAAFQLVKAGLNNMNIEILTECTFCNLRFFSFRRDGGNTGRMISMIELDSRD